MHEKLEALKIRYKYINACVIKNQVFIIENGKLIKYEDWIKKGK